MDELAARYKEEITSNPEWRTAFMAAKQKLPKRNPLDCQDDEASNSTYEVCPKCQNDLDLIEGKEGPTFVMQQFGGQILDALTKKPILHEQAKQNAIAESRGFDRSAYELKKERQVDKEDAAIDAYIKACWIGSSGN